MTVHSVKVLDLLNFNPFFPYRILWKKSGHAFNIRTVMNNLTPIVTLKIWVPPPYIQTIILFLVTYMCTYNFKSMYIYVHMEMIIKVSRLLSMTKI